MTDRDLRLLAAADPVPPARTAGRSRSAWGQETLDRILAGDARPARRRRAWPPLAGAAGLAALAALFAVLVIATGGGGEPTVATTETVVTAPDLAPARLDDVAATIRRRADLLGAGHVTVERRGDRIVVTQAEGADPLPLTPGRLLVAERDATGGTAPFPAARTIGVRSARVSAPDAVVVQATDAGADAFAAATRGAVQRAVLESRADGRIALILDGEVLAQPTISATDYPMGIDGSAGIEVPSEHPALVAALLATPLPDLDVRPER